MTWVFLPLLIGVVGTALVFRGDILSPSRLYLCVYSLLLAIYGLGLSQLQTPWSLTTHLFWWGASAMFLGGAGLMALLRSSQRPSWRLDFGLIRRDLVASAGDYDWDWYFRVWAWCFVLYLLSWTASWLILGDVPALMANPEKSRIKFFNANPIANYGIFLGPLSIMLFVYAWAIRAIAGRRLRLMGWCSVAAVLLYLTIVTRYDLFRLILFAMVMVHYARKPLGLKAMVGLVVLLGFLFIAAFLVRVNVQALDAVNEALKLKMPKELIWMSNAYAYVANDFWNFDFAISRFVDGPWDYPTQWGLGLFRPFLMQLHLEWPLIQSFGMDTVMNESVQKVKGLNTVVYAWHFYKDFGVVGVYLLPLMFGLAIGGYYQRLIVNPSGPRLAYMGLFVGALALSFHTPLWEMWFFYLNLGVFWLAHRKVGRGRLFPALRMDGYATIGREPNRGRAAVGA